MNWIQRHQTRILDVISLVIIFGISIKLGLNHAAWVRQDTAPMLDEDSGFHGIHIVREYLNWIHDPSFQTLFPSGNYPPLVSWAAWIGFILGGLNSEVLRLSQVPFTGLLCLGTSLLAWRIWGRMAAVAAAGLCIVYPPLWIQYSNIMRMAPLAAMSALSYASIPLMREKRHLFLAGLGGGLFGLASLVHVAFVYFGVPLALYVVLRGVWLARKMEVVVWVVMAVVVAGPWWFPNLLMISSVVDNHWDYYRERPDIWGQLYFLVRLKEIYLPGPHYFAIVLGLPLSIGFAWKRPLAVGVVWVAVAGFCGLLSFPQAHDRYYLPMIPLLTAIAVAPVGVLNVPGPLRWLRAAIGLGLAGAALFWGLQFSALGLTSESPSIRGYNEIAETFSLMAVHPPRASIEQQQQGAILVRRGLWTYPHKWVLSAPHPDGNPVPTAALGQIIADDMRNLPPIDLEREILQLNSDLLIAGIGIEVALHGYANIRIVAPHTLPESTALDLRCSALPCYAVGFEENKAVLAQLSETGFVWLGHATMTVHNWQVGRQIGVWRRQN